MQEQNQARAQATDPNASGEHKASTEESPLVEVEMTVSAPAHRLFEAWSRPELIQQWWGPEGFGCPEAKLDFSVGGKYHLCMKSDDGEIEIWSIGHYLVIEPGKKIVCSDRPGNERGEPISAEDQSVEGPFADVGEAIITAEFEQLNEQATRLRLSHEGLPARMHDDCVDGWRSSLTKLKRLVESSSVS
jgi:uncharacterized protein YndB with AHSA1/START domain